MCDPAFSWNGMKLGYCMATTAAALVIGLNAFQVHVPAFLKDTAHLWLQAKGNPPAYDCLHASHG